MPIAMMAEYDLSKMKPRRNPYARKLKKQITLRLDPEVIECVKAAIPSFRGEGP
jgi:uncharacterized protein (DUF4415 family)